MICRLSAILVAGACAVGLAACGNPDPQGAVAVVHRVLVATAQPTPIATRDPVMLPGAVACLRAHPTQPARNDCLAAFLRHRAARRSFPASVRAACDTLSPTAQRALVDHDENGGLGVNDFLVLVAAVGGGGYPPSCEAALTASDAIGGSVVLLYGVMDETVADAITSARSPGVTVVSHHGDDATLRVGASHKTVALRYAGGRWQIAALDFAR